ncbi:hypothetical protein HMPREF1531_02463 [Propionibacterium sp. oral taxon 192 str. F0372]|nr:hypothetical protein HMPREF1531_02463 [Propionibacterium sp. oral taxon 192 str. F0372]
MWASAIRAAYAVFPPLHRAHHMCCVPDILAAAAELTQLAWYPARRIQGG